MIPPRSFVFFVFAYFLPCAYVPTGQKKPIGIIMNAVLAHGLSNIERPTRFCVYLPRYSAVRKCLLTLFAIIILDIVILIGWVKSQKKNITTLQIVCQPSEWLGFDGQVTLIIQNLWHMTIVTFDTWHKVSYVKCKSFLSFRILRYNFLLDFCRR